MAEETHPLAFRSDHLARAGLLGPEVCLSLDLGVGDELARTLRQAQALSDHEQVVGPDLQTVASHALLGQVGEIAKAFLQQWAGPLPRHGSGPVEQLFKHSRASGRVKADGKSSMERSAYVVQKTTECEVIRW